MPSGYQKGVLWFYDVLPSGVDLNDELSLIIHSSRFDRLAVTFVYADGKTERQGVRSGDFGEHWRAGGQLAFRAPQRDARLVGFIMRFDKVASARLLRMRLVENGEEATQTTGLAALVGAALTLLLVGAIYNASLALTMRNQFSAWQASWAVCMIAWGSCWSQLHLFFLPWMAGAVSAQICTGLSCLAISLATLSAVTALDKSDVAKWLRGLALGLTLAVSLLGIPISLMRSGPIDLLGSVLSLAVLADLLVVTCCLGQAWRRGSLSARRFAGAWAVPMVALASTNFFDADAMFWGGGSQILVLFAAAWQTLWLSVAASRSHARLKMERDLARHAEAQAQELARRDVLTGLPNRRGFIERSQAIMGAAHDRDEAIALLLIDVDWFKSINDVYGHDAGDAVLQAIGECLADHESASCAVARLGGEEFAIMIAGLMDMDLMNFADGLRTQIRDCRHGERIGNRPVTVSIGVAQSVLIADFQALYRLADEALYQAKRGGRDQVSVRSLDFSEAGPDGAEAMILLK